MQRLARNQRTGSPTDKEDNYIRITFVVISALALLAGLSNLVGCGSSSNAADRKESGNSAPVLVRLANVEHTNADLPVRAVGRLEAKEELRLSFKLGGIIDRVLVDEGQRVAKDQLLATLRSTEVDAELALAQNGFDKADRDLRRMKYLFEDSAVALEQLQNASTAWEVAKAGLDAAIFNHQHSRIYAPSEGRILKRLADDHEQVAPGSPVFIVAGFEKGWVVRAGLADRDLMRVTTGDSALIEFDALPGKIMTGIVSEIGASPNPVNGTYEVELRVSSSTDRLVSGLIGKIAIKPTLEEPMSLVPIEALVEANGTSGYLFAPGSDKNTARKVPVTISYVHDGKAGLVGDLSGIDAVITAGATKLTDGAPVTIVR
ncbi:MAG: efflux RND transporter periplasmic adaptor subunit [candidate division Zixibacteria bacterium]|nr:efflux RND transporter periplasmic adaptor subunit [candidate division Zixibacteria bacterium]